MRRSRLLANADARRVVESLPASVPGGYDRASCARRSGWDYRCRARSRARRRPTAATDDAPDAAHDRDRAFTIWLGGARVGTAIERERWHGDELVLTREEAMRFRRGAAVVSVATTIEIAASSGSGGIPVASHVRWTEREGREQRHAEATHDARGWHVDTGVAMPADAVPAELVPVVARMRGGRFEGPVFFISRGCLTGAGRVTPIAHDRRIARVALPHDAQMEATIDVDAAGDTMRVVDGEGVIAVRATRAQIERAFEPVDLIAATAIPITGTPSHTLTLATTMAIPPVPGQLARRDRGMRDVVLELSPELPGSLPYGTFGPDRTREIRSLVAAVRARIAPDLGARPSTADDAPSATAGDCTTFALAYTALAVAHGIPTRVVTGFRIDDDRLIRHRWAISWTGKAWISVDAAFGTVRAGGNLIGLALHGTDDAGLIAGEAALARVRGATWDAKPATPRHAESWRDR